MTDTNDTQATETTTEATSEYPKVLGKMGEDEVELLNRSRQEVMVLLSELGKLYVRRQRMQDEMDKVDDALGSMRKRIETLEVDARAMLDEVGKRFEIADGVMWEAKPDGTVALLDPDLTRAG